MEFKRNIIDCYIVSSTPKDMNSPLVIRSRYNEKEFIYTVLHELIHTMFADNFFKQPKEFGKHSKTTINHIVLFALIEKYYLEVVEDKEFLEKIKEISNSEVNKEYKKAWDIVEEKGYQDIIKTAITN